MSDVDWRIFPIQLTSTHLVRPAWTLWGTAPPDGAQDWFLARDERVLLFESEVELGRFVDRAEMNHSFSWLPVWSELARAHLFDDVAEFSFDEDGMWLLDNPASWSGPRRAEMVDMINLFWDAANQFDDKARISELRGDGRGGVLGRLADAIMEDDDETLNGLQPREIRAAFRDHAEVLFARCAFVV